MANRATNIYEEKPRLWGHPKRPPPTAHSAPQPKIRVIETHSIWYYLGSFRLRLLVGLALFILLAHIYDAKVNYRSWTEKPPPRSDAGHSAAIQQTPEQ